MFTAYVGCHSSAAECLCPHAACQGAQQNLSHVFVECALARPVLCWLAQVWAAVTGEAPRALTAAPLLAGDYGDEWPLARALRPLWTRLRLAALWHLWCAARRSRPPGEPPPTPALVAGRILHDCRAAMRRDWVRVRADVARGAGVPTDWLRGRSLGLSLEAFQARWCHRGVLCAAEEPAQAPDVRWTAYHPVPVAIAAVGVG